MRSASLLGLLATLVLPAQLAGQDAEATTPERRPNVVLIVVDDLGWADVSPNNPDTFYETPNIERLAKGGLRLTDGYSSCPVCSPSRYSLMTGRSPVRAQATNYFSGRRAETFRGAEFSDRMPLEEETIAETLQSLGYRTFFAGKWHLGPDESFWPEKQGFEVNRGGWKSGGPYGPGKYFTPYGNPRLEDGPEGEHLPIRLAEETASFVERCVKEEGPFFATLCFYSVHTPLVGPKELVQKYRDKRERLGLADAEAFGEERQVFRTDRKRRVRILQNHAVYAAMVESMDRAVGIVLDQLAASGVEEETLVIFTSDHGGLSTSEGLPTSNLPFRGGKGWLYEGGVRVPWIVRWPGRVPAGETTDRPATGPDIAPTILAAAAGEAKPEKHLDGRSQLAHWLDPTTDQAEPRSLFWHYPHYGNQGGFPGAAMRRGRHKVILDYEDGRSMLFDLEADPGERNDLAEREPGLHAEMREELLRYLADTGARFLRVRKDGPAPWRPGR